MYCNRCGKPLPAESRFCNSCGSIVRDERKTVSEGGRIEVTEGHLQPAPEDIVFRTRPSFFAVGNRYLAAALLSMIAAAVIGYFGLPFLFLLPVILVSFAFPLVKHIQRNRILYTLTTNKIEIEYGIISKTVRNIPLRNVQDVTVSSTLSERLIRVGDVVIDSAAEAGKIRMRQIPNPRQQADLILANMSRWR